MKHANQSRAGGFHSISSMYVLQNYMPASIEHESASVLRRKSYSTPEDRGLFIKPIKTAFVQNARLSPGSRLCLLLLTGWAGQETTISTTMCTIGRHLGRSRRQVFRYLKDLMEEGYLLYSKKKDRLGYITGIKIWVNFGAVRHKYRNHINRKKEEFSQHKRAKTERNQDVTYTSQINPKYFLNTPRDEILDHKLTRLAQAMGYDFPITE